MKTILTIFLFLASLQAHANSNLISLDCRPTKPCAYAEEIGKCVSLIQIHGSLESLTETIQYSPQDIRSEILLAPDQYALFVSDATGAIRFQDETGDQNGALHFMPGGQYQGQITVDEDFAFEVTCTDKAIGFE